MIDWTSIYRKFKGKWVALKEDEKTIITSADSFEEVMAKAGKSGYVNPLVMRVPEKIINFVGWSSNINF